MSILDTMWNSVSRFLDGAPAGSHHTANAGDTNPSRQATTGNQDSTRRPSTDSSGSDIDHSPLPRHRSSGRQTYRQSAGAANTGSNGDSGREQAVRTDGGHDSGSSDDRNNDPYNADDEAFPAFEDVVMTDGGQNEDNGGNGDRYPQEVDKDRPHREREYDMEIQPGAYDRYADRYEFKAKRRPEITLLELGDEENGAVDVAFNEFVTREDREYAEILLRTERPQNRGGAGEGGSSSEDEYRHIMEAVPIRQDGRGDATVDLGRYHEAWKETEAYGVKKDNGWLNSDGFELRFASGDELYEVHSTSGGGGFGFL